MKKRFEFFNMADFFQKLTFFLANQRFCKFQLIFGSDLKNHCFHLKALYAPQKRAFFRLASCRLKTNKLLDRQKVHGIEMYHN